MSLPGELGAEIEDWIAGAVTRSGLTVRDVRRGVQSVSSVYVQSRGAGRIGARATEGPARRAALSSYYAPLHFLASYHTLAALVPGSNDPSGWRRILDLGCGTAACGIAAARALGSAASILGIDRSGWLLGEARHSFAAFGVAGRTRRAMLPQALPRLRSGDLAVAGYLLNELGDSGREILLRGLVRGVGEGARVLILEPLSGAISPWWDAAAETLAPVGVRASLLKFAIERPDWIASIDQASGLDHREIGARVLSGPGW